MSCPSREDLTRWTDGECDAAESRALSRHVYLCASCREAAASWRKAGAAVSGLAEPGPDCLGPEAMAALLDGRPVPAHVETCPRCAAELEDLRPSRRRTSLRFVKAGRSPAGWVAAAAVFLVAVLLLVVSRPPRPAGEPAAVQWRIPRPPPLPEPEPLPDLPVPEAPRIEPPPAPAAAPKPEPKPEPRPAVAAPEPRPAEPAPKPAETKPTVVERVRSLVALGVRGGALSTFENGKWVHAKEVEEGAVVRADGRTTVEFARARVTLDASSRVSFMKDELALAEGGLSADVSTGSKFTLALGSVRVAPAAAFGRVLLCARPDRLVIEEGLAKAGGLVLANGVEHKVAQGTLEPQKRRSLPAAARPRETRTWRLDLSKPETLRKGLSGRVDVTAEGRMLVSEEVQGDLWAARVAYGVFDDPKGLVQVRPTTAVRLRYFLLQPGPMEFIAWNITKDENFNLPIETVHGQWTTLTFFLKDVPANSGGKKVVCEPGDRFRGFAFMAGKPGTPATLVVDLLEIVEIER
jgi:hypothetical protein